MSSVLEKIPIIGSLYDSPEEQAVADQINATAAHYRAMKPEVAQSYENAMGNQLQAYAPANAFLGGMVGNEYMLDLDKMGQSPVTPGLIDPATGGPVKTENNFLSGDMGLPDGLGMLNTLSAPVDFIGGLF